MFRILQARFIAPLIKRFLIEAPRIARKHQAGQFVIVRLHEQGERILLTIESSDAADGTISIVVQSVGKTTVQLNRLEAGDGILDVVGPLGKPSVIEKLGTVVVVGGGVGTALVYPTTVALKRAGNRIVTILGGRNRDLVILEREMRAVSDALYVTTDDNVLSAITGRVCPQEDHCEGNCVLTKKVQSLGIGYLERFVAEYEQRLGVPLAPKAASTGKKVAIVGSGPAGLSAAGDLVAKGHRVQMFEALHEIGGVLTYGIPEFRLPKQVILDQIDTMRAMGVEFETNVVVGKTVEIDELFELEGYNAVFIATGAGLPVFLNIPGEHLNGVYSANECLTRINLMHAHEFPRYDESIVNLKDKNVAVVGGGNTALDAIRSARRLGAANAYLLYRRSEIEMPARVEEVNHAKQEGIDFQILTNPVEFLEDGGGWLRAARCVRLELGEADSSGRRRPMPIPGSEFEISLSEAIIATGTSANPLIQSTTPGLKTNPRGYIEASSETQRTSRKGVFAGGDIVTGGAMVILAMASGRRWGGIAMKPVKGN
jgi:glutamate synthase (NADPH) small chain